MPLGMGFLIFAAKNPDISHKLGLISAKANLVSYAGTDWSSYMSLMPKSSPQPVVSSLR